MKNFLIAVGVIFLICAIAGGCTDSSSGTKYSGYSKTYNDDAEYRSNVKDIAEAYGISEYEVDQKINAVSGGK